MRKPLQSLIVAFALLAFTSNAFAETKSAIFAGGCFWCVEADFDHIKGVVATTSGYMGGTLDNPTYENHEGYREAVKVDYDPALVSYATLLHDFWRLIDPLDDKGQFCDRGYAYSPAIYTSDSTEISEAEASRNEAAAVLKTDIKTPILPATRFWPAEAYHQNYYQVNPLHYKYYRYACGRDKRVDEVWGKTSD